MNCRHCGVPLERTFLDLGSAPPSNAFLRQHDLLESEAHFPLRIMVCEACWLVQTLDFTDAGALFSSDYAYFSSYSTSWLDHAERFVRLVAGRFALGGSSHVVEIASNDGYLLQYVAELGIPCMGIEPTASTAAAARGRGVETLEIFFGARTAAQLVAEGKSADLTVANNVLAHVPDINDFVEGFAILLKPNGVASFEFPHLVRLIQGAQFDTIYHEHFSYLSLSSVDRILTSRGLTIIDVEELPTHGGSLRVFAQRSTTGTRPRTAEVGRILEWERDEGVGSSDFYSGLQARAERIKDDFLSFLIQSRRAGKTVAAYGAAAKGNTLINFAGCRPDLISFVVDQNPWKQGRYLPGSRIPIVSEERFAADRPDYIVILPWNLQAEIVAHLGYAREWGVEFVTAVPQLAIF